uniref:Uncharacterized protein n=1 Tax=viral metagenome TaxID=1070528 RepID=A0A6C0IGU8_9ZZZZ
MDTFERQLHCDEFYCGICKQIYPSHLGIPWYGRLDCPWCHDCMKNGAACTICANVPALPHTSMAVKRVCKVKLTLIEAAIGESVSYSQVGTIYEHTTNWLEPYKKKSVGVAVADAVNAILDASLQLTEKTVTATATATVPPPLDTCAPELDCLSHKQNAPMAHTSLTQDASWSIHKIE